MQIFLKLFFLISILLTFTISEKMTGRTLAQEEEPEEENLNINVFGDVKAPKKHLKAREDTDNVIEELFGDCSTAIEIDNAMIINLEEEVKIKPLSYTGETFLLIGEYKDNDLRFDLCEPFHQGLFREGEEYKVIAKTFQGNKKYKLAGRFTFPIISEDTEEDPLAERKIQKKTKN